MCFAQKEFLPTRFSVRSFCYFSPPLLLARALATWGVPGCRSTPSDLSKEEVTFLRLGSKLLYVGGWLDADLETQSVGRQHVELRVLRELRSCVRAQCQSKQNVELPFIGPHAKLEKGRQSTSSEVPSARGVSKFRPLRQLQRIGGGKAPEGSN